MVFRAWQRGRVGRAGGGAERAAGSHGHRRRPPAFQSNRQSVPAAQVEIANAERARLRIASKLAQPIGEGQLDVVVNPGHSNLFVIIE